MKTLSERIAEDRITIGAMGIGVSENGSHGLWRVTLARPTHWMGKRGEALFKLPDPFENPLDEGKPTAFDVLDLLTAHCSVVDQAHDRIEWAAQFTTDAPGADDPHFGEKQWQAWVEIDRRLAAFLGAARYQEYLYDTDRSE